MLPGFRFLFAAIMLSMSLLIFALGAAALLRAAHEEVASNPSWRAAPEVTFAQPAEAERPVLAALRVDLPASEKWQAYTPPTAAVAEQTATAPVPVDASALTASETGQPGIERPEIAKSEAVKDEATVAENAVAREAAAASVEKQAAPQEIQVAAIATREAAPAGDSPPPLRSEPLAAQAASGATSGAARIATLGGPPVDIEETPRKVKVGAATPDQAQPDQGAVKKHAHAGRASRRRMAALRARLAAQQLAQQQLQLNPFFQQPLQQPIRQPTQQPIRQPLQQPPQAAPAH